MNMKLFRRALGVLFLVACTVSAQPNPNPVGGAVNSITVTAANTGTKGSVNLGGTFTTKDALTTLTAIDGYAYPVSGGVVSIGGGAKQNPAVAIDNQKGIWTSVIVGSPALTAQTYMFRVVGTFSDNTKVSSQYFNATPSGDQTGNAGLTILWAAGFPKSTQALKFSSQGTYTGNPSMTAAKYVYGSISGGGVISPTGDITFGQGTS